MNVPFSERKLKNQCSELENPTSLTNTDINSEIPINGYDNGNNKTPDNKNNNGNENNINNENNNNKNKNDNESNNDSENDKDNNKKSISFGIDKGLILFSAFLIAGSIIGFIYYQYPSRKKNETSFMIINENNEINDISSMVINENMTTMTSDIYSSDNNKNIESTVNNNAKDTKDTSI